MLNKYSINANDILKHNDLQKACTKCEGTGQEMHACSKCKGTGRCSNKLCFKGKIKYRDLKGLVKKSCSICKAKGICLKCEGEKEFSKECSACRSKGSKIDISKIDAFAKNHIAIALSASKELTNGGEGKSLAQITFKAYGKKALEESGSITDPEKIPGIDTKEETSTEENEGIINFDPEEIIEPRSTAKYLKHVISEIKDKIDADVRRGGIRIANDIYGQPTLPWGPDSKNQLILVATDAFLATDVETQKTLVNGYANFWLMRLKSNGLFIEQPCLTIVMDDNGNITHSVSLP